MDFNFLSKKNKNGDGEERKIEFSQKLSPEDKEDLPKSASPLKKGEGFNFLKKKIDEREKSKEREKPIDEKPSFVLSPPTPKIGTDERKKAMSVGLSEAEKEDRGVKEKKGFSFGFFKKGRKGRKEEPGRADILDVNLVRGEIVKFFDWQKNILILLVCVFLSLFVLALVYWGISWWGSRVEYTKDPFLAQSYFKLDKQIKELNDEIEEVFQFKQKMDTVDDLLDRHIYWTNFFNFLEENTLSNVYFSDFSGNIGGQYSLSAHTNDFDAIDAQVKKFVSNEYVIGANVSSGAVSRGGGGSVGISFRLSFSLNPDLFVK